MKKLFYIWAAAVILTMITTSASFASFVPFNEFKIVGSSGDTSWSGSTDSNGLPIFSLTQTPVLYLQLPNNFIFADINTTWNSPTGPSYDKDKYQSFWQGNNVWLSLSKWNTVKTTGTWTVDGSYNALLCKTGSAQASFVVTPEPMALTLYGIGGLPLLAHFIRRRKMMTV
ncbi:MAG: hypothetical protein HGA80_08430 [Candidatus Omnitrophica bacterium]|nr:hypothetical protein [Candidatus Omnitrophota bacterium]